MTLRYTLQVVGSDVLCEVPPRLSLNGVGCLRLQQLEWPSTLYFHVFKSKSQSYFSHRVMGEEPTKTRHWVCEKRLALVMNDHAIMTSWSTTTCLLVLVITESAGGQRSSSLFNVQFPRRPHYPQKPRFCYQRDRPLFAFRTEGDSWPYSSYSDLPNTSDLCPPYFKRRHSSQAVVLQICWVVYCSMFLSMVYMELLNFLYPSAGLIPVSANLPARSGSK